VKGTAKITAIMAAALLALTVLSQCARAQSGERPEIREVSVYTDGSSLLCDVWSAGMLNERIEGTVRSGLPAVVELFYQLKSKGRGGSLKGIRSWSLRYDVWEDVYSVSDGDTTVTLESMESMERMISTLRGISLAPFSRLTAGKTFAVKFRIAVNPFAGSQDELVSGWIDESGEQRQESTWREQVLNVNDLVSRLFSGDRAAETRSDWFETERLYPERLKRADRSER
jgi:hypothetical protein